MSASYCTVAEIGTLGVNADAVADLDPARKQQAIDTISDQMDSALGTLFTLPLVDWGMDWRTCCAVLAAAELLRTRGSSYDPEDAFWSLVKAKERYLENVARRFNTPRVTDSSSSSKPGVPQGAGLSMVSAPASGFSRMPSPFGGCNGGGSFGT